MTWEDKSEVKKGNFGEELVDQYLLDLGYTIYSPFKTNNSHPFDRICISRDKSQIFIAECKTKPKRKFYPDTGFDIKHYNVYMQMQEKTHMNVFVFFIDELEKKIYGNFLTKLNESKTILHNGNNLKYPLTQYGIIYFPIESMIDITDISTESAQFLSSVNSIS